MLYYPRKYFLTVREFLLHFMSFWMNFWFLVFYTFVIFGHSMQPFFLTKCLKNFFFVRFCTSPFAQSISQDYCQRWKQSIPELTGPKYSVIQLLSIICHTCRMTLAIHSWLNSSHHLCEMKQTICKCHAHFFSWILLIFLFILSFHLCSLLFSFLSVCT